jgi:urea carboxylase
VASVIEILSTGAMTTVQDWPGRVGLWEVGVPPSGPMDARSLRIANLLVGNDEGAAALEITLTGPRLRFPAGGHMALTGAPVSAKLNDQPVTMWESFDIAPGSVLSVGAIRGAGLRCYLAARGGIAVEPVLGSRSTFVAAHLGGASLAVGDTLALGPAEGPRACVARTPAELIPQFGNQIALRVVPGPHGAPDFLTPDGLAELFAVPWSVHHQSDRTGVRLVGPQPRWARVDGGAAGLHPSNILDSAYGVGTVMLSGDVGVVVGVDGPSLGGFAAIGQVIRADLWRLGQLRAGDDVHLQAIAPEDAGRLHADAEAQIRQLRAPAGVVESRVRAHSAAYPSVGRSRRADAVRSAILARTGDGAHGAVTYRCAGEGAVLVEFGDPVLDLRSRVRVHTLQQRLRDERVRGIRDLTPGVRSLHVQFEPEQIDLGVLLEALSTTEASTPAPETVAIEANTVSLPLAWRHSQAMLAVARYQSSVFADAPWCPDNIEFIRRINDLPDEAAVRAIVTGARYLVLGLGDVYMGAPIAVPLDPRHRLVTTKYTPARTWTPANAVGIGGAFLCVYGIEGPGGYQLVGRTVPIWYPGDASPCLLGHFDQLRFELVGEDELETLRADAQRESWRPHTEPAHFSLDAYQQSLEPYAEETARFTARRQAAFDAERRAWQANAVAAANRAANGVDEAAA